ncbi:MAG TPA: 3-deoxy-manno-octulosonate cytidylyltransferase [Candidatus Acidoferrales bacterium]|nr:3-deoxy-manno-octulosonate cytidylyltransferase [Candidatus Acidoferrales bacterium]
MPRKILGVIPARFASSRFPGKVLAKIAAKTMLQHVYERANMATYLTSTIIATDDQRVYDAARSFGARVTMTRSDHLSGTDRVAEAASADNAEIIVNIQGDEPLIDPAAIDASILPMVHEPGVVMSTLKKRIEDVREIGDPNVVKVVTNREGEAIYFSRCPIPYEREPERAGAETQARTPVLLGTPHFKHIGLYVYQRDFLLSYSALPVGPLERAERLEQLRALENGFRIRVVETEYESLGVDTPEDLERVSRLFEASIFQGVRNG